MSTTYLVDISTAGRTGPYERPKLAAIEKNDDPQQAYYILRQTCAFGDKSCHDIRWGGWVCDIRLDVRLGLAPPPPGHRWDAFIAVGLSVSPSLSPSLSLSVCVCARARVWLSTTQYGSLDRVSTEAVFPDSTLKTSFLLPPSSAGARCSVSREEKMGGPVLGGNRSAEHLLAVFLQDRQAARLGGGTMCCHELRVEVKHFSFYEKMWVFSPSRSRGFGVPWGSRYTHARPLKR